MDNKLNANTDGLANVVAERPAAATAVESAAGPVLEERIQRQFVVERQRWAGQFRRGLAVMILVLLVFMALLLAIGLAVVKGVQREAQSYARHVALETSKALQTDSQADTVARLAKLSMELGEVTATAENLAEAQEQARALLQQQEAMRAREREIIKSDMVRFRVWYENESTTLIQRVTALQTEVSELGQKQAATPVPAEQRVLFPTSPAPVGVEFLAASNSATSTALVAVAGAKGVDESNVLAAAAARERVKITSPSGEAYEGTVVNGLPDGEGTCLYPNGNRYTGQFKKGKRHGRGTYVFANGDKYEGAYEEDARQGPGEYVYRDGNRYEGDFRAGKRHGKGKYYYRDGGQYIGDFKDGKKEGWGTYVGTNGMRLEGTWQSDQFLGSGSLPH